MPNVRSSQSQNRTVSGDAFLYKSPVVEDYESDLEDQPFHIRAAERERSKGKRRQSLNDTRYN